jgi:hypothetical protein
MALDILQESHYSTGIRLFLVKSRDQVAEFVNRRVRGIALFNHDAVLFTHNENSGLLLNHEIFHVISIRLWGQTEPWICEGSAVYAEGRCNQHNIHTLAAFLIENRMHFPLDSLFYGGNFYQLNDLIAFMQSGSLFQYLYEKYDLSVIQLLWKKGTRAFLKSTGCSAADLEKEWIMYIRSLQTDTGNIDWDDLMKRGCN